MLVIGGGDGGVARELGPYKEIETIDVVEPDRVFVEVCKDVYKRQVLKGVTCDVVIVILCGLIHLSAHIKKKPRKKY